MGCQVTSLEETFNNMRGSDPSLRHNSYLRATSAALESSLRLLRLGRHESVIIHPNALYKKAQKLQLGNMSQKDRRKFVSDCRHAGSISLPKVLQVLRTFTKFLPLEEVVGYRKYGQVSHYIADHKRMKHILGLSDAVSQAISNFGLRVQFPGTCSFPVMCSSNHIQKISRVRRFYSRVSDKKGYPQFEIRAIRNKGSTKRPRFDLLLHYLSVFPKGLAEKDYVKLIKLSLAGTFSEKMSQDLPEGYPEKAIPLFPAFTQKKLDAVLGGPHKSKRVQFYFNLLQSKALCAPVGEDMIKESYEKHCASLCRPPDELIPKDSDLYEKLKNHAAKFFRENCSYEPYTTSLPNARASIEANRSEGGNREALLKSGTLQRYNRCPLLGMMDDSQNSRMEPYVIGLFGQPGSGKTTLTSSLVSRLRQTIAPNLDREKFVYSRSCSTKHWDGYCGQPVVVLDDFGQDLADRQDLAEFMTLVSINDYVLPMADLSEKGQKFRSPIVIVTSNMGFGIPSVRGQSLYPILEDSLALWRRFDLALAVYKQGPGLFPRLHRAYLFDQPTNVKFYHKKHFSSDQRRWNLSVPLDGHEAPDLGHFREFAEKPFKDFEELSALIKDEISDKFNFHSRTFHDSWTQHVHSFKVDYQKTSQGPLWDPQIEEVDPSIMDHHDSIALDFPINPPLTPPVVKAQALSEPLKVRMITVAEADTKVLQPLQRSLWRGLGRCKQFCLTNGVKDLEDFESETLEWIHRIEAVIKRIHEYGELWSECPKWLSGDYTSATDNFPMWATEALTEGILLNIDHEPTRKWVRWEISAHKIRYPHGVGDQTSGQLMGSLLSFPLLCLLNDFVMQESGFHPDTYLVNGDDVVAYSDMENIDRWKRLAPRVGLSLSLGKNFIDPDFCTVNSQLFYKAEVLHTGKVSTQKRTGTTISYCFSEAQFYWGATPELKENFLTRNWVELSNTPRSLHYCKEHGGLGLIDTQSMDAVSLDQRLAKEVYLHDVLKPFGQIHRVQGAPFSFVCFPVLRGEAAADLQGTHPSQSTFERFQSLGAITAPEADAFDDLTHAQFRRWRRELFEDLPQSTLDLFSSLTKRGEFNLEEAPPSRSLDREYVAVTNGLARRYARHSVCVALSLLNDLWLSSHLDPFEYIDIWEYPPPIDENDYAHYALDVVRLFQEGVPESEDGDVIKDDVLKFWKEYSPDSLSSLNGGAFFRPRPQGFSELEEFLSSFATNTDDVQGMDTCPQDDND